MKCFESVKSVWLGHASEDHIRRNGASGGAVTGILCYLLRERLIEGAVVTVPDPDRCGRGKSIFAMVEEDIMRSAKSIYTMTSIAQGLKESYGRIAVVGLPCQISSVRQDAIKIGLFCGHSVLPSGVDEALTNMGINPMEVRSICYRSSGWYPFMAKITMKSGKEIEFPWEGSSFKKMWDSGRHWPSQCLYCKDFLADDADISCGDAWLKELYGNRQGYNLIVVREKGHFLMEDLLRNHALSARQVDLSYLIRSNRVQLERKARNHD